MNRSPLRRRTSLRRVGRKRASVAQLDALCRAVVFKRDGGRCVRCGSERHVQWCHVYTRRIHAVRWDVDNSFVGCAGCHLWWHHRPLDSAAWFREAFPTRAERLKKILHWGPRVGKPDREAIKIALEAELR